MANAIDLLTWVWWILAEFLLSMALLFWALTRIDYRIDDCHLRVVWFGVTVRRIALTDIENVRAGYAIWNEHWCNSLWPIGRWVTIRRKSGLFRDFVITPKDRDAFIRELKAKAPNLSS